MLRRTEKEQRVIELYQQGKTIREIAHEVHMSFADIGAIKRKITGLQDDNNNAHRDLINRAADEYDAHVDSLNKAVDEYNQQYARK